MNVNYEIIKDVVAQLLLNSTEKDISDYINDAISKHRQVLPQIKPTIEHENTFIFIFYAEVNDSSIELIGFKFDDQNKKLRKEKKIRIITKKDSQAISDLLIVLYTNIASNIQL